MKKLMILCILTIGLSGCTFSNSDAVLIQAKSEIPEKGAHLKILMDDTAYAQELVRLWNTTYPKNKGALEIIVQPYADKKKITYDIEWIKDEDLYNRETLYKLADLHKEIAIKVEDHLQRDKDYFLPIEGKGMLFVYNIKELRKKALNIEEVTSFEQLEGLGNHIYYHNRNAKYVDPFLFTAHNVPLAKWIKNETFYENIATYRKLNKTLSLNDDFINTDFFMSESYICGLIESDASYKNSTAYQRGELKFSKMPTYEGKEFSPVVDTYGFVINKEVAYPEAALAFLRLVRSEKGIKALIEHTDKTILIEQNQVEEIVIFDRCRKDRIAAMNSSQLRDRSLDNKLEQSRFYEVLQNSLFTKESNKVTWKKLIKELT